MQLVWILLIAAAITVIEILIYHYRLPRFFLFIFPLINICLEICIVFYILRQQALVTSYYPLWIRIGIYLLPLLLSRLPRTQICKAGIYKTISPYRLPSVCISSDQYAFHLSHNHLFCTGICYLLSKCKSSGSGYAHGG